MKSSAVLAPSRVERSERPSSAPVTRNSAAVQQAITGMEGWTKVTIKKRSDAAPRPSPVSNPPARGAASAPARRPPADRHPAVAERRGGPDAATRRTAPASRSRRAEEEEEEEEAAAAAAAKKGKRAQLLLGDLIMRKHSERTRVPMPVPYTVKLAAAAAAAANEKGARLTNSRRVRGGSTAARRHDDAP